ncbi:hypothetical protein SCHPADRAFT_262871 [Schizopora paradoxa]|uniref:Uncharacterized protein n=1 Tax=Schizopora paradoxa TaxID=27342 RepID=A0A0H2RV61_9AGAM|nr:hypothetical protein SCHPADRAFT_262871 [Schizopora paradoxa]
MSRTPNDTLAYWRCHRSIEAYCAEKTKMLLKHMDVLFGDMASFVGSFDETLCGETLGIEAEREALEKCGMLVHVHHMQLEVLRRTIKCKYDDLNALVKKKSTMLSRINDQLASKPLPTLPIRVIARIFSHLYWSDKTIDVLGYRICEETTLQRFISDEGTSETWRSLVRELIPIAVESNGSAGEAEFDAKGNASLVGPAPKAFSIRDSKVDLASAMEMRSTTIFATLQESPDMEELEEIRSHPWHNLVLTSRETVSSEELLKQFIGRFGRELASLDRFQFAPSDRYNVFDKSAPQWDPNEPDEFVGLTTSVSRLRVVSAPAGLLPTLRPILNGIAVLEVGIAIEEPKLDSGRASINILLEGLEHYAGTLASLTLYEIVQNSRTCGTSQLMRGGSRSPSPGKERPSTPVKKLQLCRVSLPCLTQFQLTFARSVVQDVLSAVECPSLSSISISVTGNYNRLEKDHYLTAICHATFPRLEKIALRDPHALEYCESLTVPNENGTWLLPMLDSIDLHAYQQHQLLKTMTKVVINRLNSDATKAIRFLRISEFSVSPYEEAKNSISEFVDTLNLLVPEVVIAYERFHLCRI